MGGGDSEMMVTRVTLIADTQANKLKIDFVCLLWYLFFDFYEKSDF